jgi:hypothetical protein
MVPTYIFQPSVLILTSLELRRRIVVLDHVARGFLLDFLARRLEASFFDLSGSKMMGQTDQNRSPTKQRQKKKMCFSPCQRACFAWET